jgi:hypothetical protein
MQNSDCPSALVQQMLTADRKLARCMRSHGVPNFPDPTTDSNGPVFNITNAGISDAASHTGEFEDKLTECARLVGGNAPESFEWHHDGAGIAAPNPLRGHWVPGAGIYIVEPETAAMPSAWPAATRSSTAPERRLR